MTVIPTKELRLVLDYNVDEREHFISWLYEEYDFSCESDADGEVSEEELEDAIEEMGLDETSHVYVAMMKIEKWLEEAEKLCPHCGGETAMNDGRRQCQDCGAW